MEQLKLQQILQAIIQASTRPVALAHLERAFREEKAIKSADLQLALEKMMKKRDPIQALKKVAGGYQYHIKTEYTPWIQKAQNERGTVEKLNYALNETLGIIAYKQPIDRKEIDFIRGVSTNISVFQELEEREWVRVVAYGGDSKRAGLYATTNTFLEYFGLNSLEDLPVLKTPDSELVS